MFSFDPKDFKFHVFTDSDGVLYNFEGYWQDRFGKPWDSFHPDWAWDQIGADPGFYAKIPLFDHARDYWDFLQPFNPTVLTGCPRAPRYDDAVAAKLVAWKRDFNVEGDRIITCLTRDKPLHMKQPGDILIDDHMRNIKAWRRAGGTGILFVDAAQALEEFVRTVEALQQAE